MDEAISMFMMVTEADENVARRYLGMTEGNLEQATTLFFDSPDLGASPVQATHETPPIPRSTRPQQYTTGGDGAREAVEIDSDEDDMDFVDQDDQEATRAAAVGRAADYEDDEAIARRMQEELYASGGTDAEGVRAPIERTTETLVGGPGGDYGDDFSPAMQFLRNRAGRAEGQPGPFSQRADFRPGPSIWDDTERDATSQRSTFTPGNEVSAKQQRLAELFRPPFDMMYRGSWDGAREEGKEMSKWLLVNVQDMSIFDCQSLNRDIWKHQGIKELVQENFIFIQYSKDDPRGAPYINYYFQMKDSSAAYPHIAIVDPRTGEQVKVWSGPPGPKAPDFLMQLVEFLDRYSLDVTKKNPVAKRKIEKPKELDVDRLTEQEMLDLALQNSLAPGGTPGPKEHDPDDLTKSFGDTGKGKGKEIEGSSASVDETANGHGSTAATPFTQILSNNPHTEPAQAPDVTRIQFRHSDGRVIRRFNVHDPVRRLYEWLKSEPLAGKEGVEFELKSVGKDLIEYLDETIEDAGLKNQTVMVEFIEG